MKTNELMVGDFITFKDCQNDKEIVVVKIWEINQDGNALVFIDDSEVLDEVAIDEEFAGIPLTPEILEKNGIVYDYDEEECVADYKFVKLKGYQYSDDEILIDYCNGHIKVISDFYGDVNMEIEYVHELQHALKLLKIEKTIEL